MVDRVDARRHARIQDSEHALVHAVLRLNTVPPIVPGATELVPLSVRVAVVLILHKVARHRIAMRGNIVGGRLAPSHVVQVLKLVPTGVLIPLLVATLFRIPSVRIS
jgi:hypothetical protein